MEFGEEDGQAAILAAKVVLLLLVARSRTWLHASSSFSSSSGPGVIEEKVQPRLRLVKCVEAAVCHMLAETAESAAASRFVLHRLCFGWCR